MPAVIASIRAEYLRYKRLAEQAIAQADEPDLTTAPPGSNSIATIVWHLSGNLASRFTEFLTSDGEKPWRNREEEFEARAVSKAALLEKWTAGWRVLDGALDALTDDDLQRTVVIRGQSLSVLEALLRSLAHTSSHVGQIVYIAKAARGEGFVSLSIPRGGSAAYNASPTLEQPPAGPPRER